MMGLTKPQRLLKRFLEDRVDNDEPPPQADEPPPNEG
jgi:hypothetical protein